MDRAIEFRGHLVVTIGALDRHICPVVRNILVVSLRAVAVDALELTVRGDLVEAGKNADSSAVLGNELGVVMAVQTGLDVDLGTGEYRKE